MGEETAETIIAAKNDSKAELILESADLLYHLLVLLVNQGVPIEEVLAELERRAGKKRGKDIRHRRKSSVLTFMITPTFEQFVEYSKQGNVIPVSKAVTADLLTPVLAYLKIEPEMAQAFLLESIEGGEKIARYSFLGCNPFLTIQAKGEAVEIIREVRPSSAKGGCWKCCGN